MAEAGLGFVRRALPIFWFVAAGLFAGSAGAIGDAETKTGLPRLVAITGMTYEEVIAQSSLRIGDGTYDRTGPYATRERSFQAEAVFDWALPGGQLVFSGCRYYSMQTAYRDDPHLVHIWVTTAPRKLTWSELKGQMYEIDRKLLADGWHPAIYGKEGSASDLLTRMLKQPTWARTDHGATSIGSVTYGKGDIALSLSARRLQPALLAEDPLAGTEFIHWIELDRRAEWNKTYDFDGSIILPP